MQLLLLVISIALPSAIYFKGEAHVFGQGLTLTIIGMVIVFVFLTLLVFLMAIMSGIIRKIEKKRTGTAKEDEGSAARETVEDYSEIAAAIGKYLQAGGVLPSPTGDNREDVAAVLAAIAAAGGPVPKGNYNEIAAAIAAVRAYK